MMIWPSITTPALRSHLFAAMSLGEPDFIVERWHEYKWELDAKYLPQPQIDKIDMAAAQVISSFDLASPVVGVLVQGHADFDLRRHGSDRVQFEADISESRAKQVEKRLRDCIGDRIVSDGQAFKAMQITWQHQAFGSHRRVTNFPHSEFERSLNRRVEVFFARGNIPPFPVVESMTCPHMGIVTRGPFARGWPSTRNAWSIIGCPNMMAISPNEVQPSPCVRVMWLPMNGEDIIDMFTIGICSNEGGVDQGIVLKVAAMVDKF